LLNQLPQGQQQPQAVSIPLSKFSDLPHRPGVYILKNSAGDVVYVGKATSINNRVTSHLHPRLDDPIGLSLKDQIHSVDYIFTQNPVEALILENILIKRYKPRYNIRLKDDKSYPYIKITDELYPRVLVTRRVEDDGGKYFGPYGNARAARRTVKFLRKLFPIRGCTLPLDGVKKFKSCIDYSIGLCKAPCIFAVTKSEYDSDVKKFQLFLEGRLVQLSKVMYDDMWKASEREDFETAAKIRDEIKSLETTALKQRIALRNREREKDVITIARQGKITAAIVFQIRGGNVVGSDKFIIEGANPNSEDSEIVSAFIKQYYGSSQGENDRIPAEIVVPVDLPDVEEIRGLLDSLRKKEGLGVRISLGLSNTENRKLLKLAQENALFVLKEEESKDEVQKRERLRALKELKEILNLYKIPRRIECFDISNIHGSEAVGAMTVFVDGFPQKSDYRRFKIKTVEGIDDYAMMAEMVGRRFRRFLMQADGDKDKQKKGKRGEDEQPDLVVIDGGRGHLNAAIAQMRKDGIFGIPVISLAKAEEVIFVPRGFKPIRLSKDSEALHVLQHIRDEAHRFGISYHRKLRARTLRTSALDKIQGIGEKRKRNLLAHFGSIDAIRRSSPEEVSQVARIGKKLAQVILSSLNN
jgi:excinuclease ABC subunit C